MLSQRTFNWICFTTKLMKVLGVAPLQNKILPNRRIIFLITKNRVSSVMIWFNFGVLCSYVLFLASRVFSLIWSFNSKTHRNIRTEVIVNLLYNFVCYVMPFLLQVNFYFKAWNEIPNFMNRYLAFFNDYSKLRSSQKNKPFVIKNGCENIILVEFLLGFMILVQNTIIILVDPKRLYFITSLEWISSSFAASNIAILFQFWMWMICWSLVFFNCFNVTGFIYVIVGILSELNAQNKRNIKREDSFGRRLLLNKLLSSYRKLQVLQNLLNICYQELAFPSHKFAVMGSAILGTYGAIKLTGFRSVIMGVTSFFALWYLSFMFQSLGRTHEFSKATLDSWRFYKNPNVAKFLRSCKTIRVEIGCFYFVRQSTVIVIWETVFAFATNMLLSF